MELLLALWLATSPGSFVVRRTPDLEVKVSPALAGESDRLARTAQTVWEHAWVRLGAAGGSAARERIAGTIVVFASLEEKALATGSTAEVSPLPDGSVACIDDPPAFRFDGRAVAALALRRAVPHADPSHPLLAAARSILADADERARALALAAWIHAAGETTPLSDLLDPTRLRRRSFLVQRPQLAVLAGLLLERGGAAALARAVEGIVSDRSALEEAFRARLDRLAAEHRAFFEARRRRRARHRRPARIRGACFAHEGYRVVDGYGSQMAARSLERLRALGADAISVTPFAFYRDPHRPDLRWRRRTPEIGSDRWAAGSETDEAVRATIAAAHRLGLRVLLKPHLWGHGWCGEITMTNEDDWRAFFEEYGEFLVHHALLAERTDCEWFSVGCELAGTTGRATPWRRLVARVRALFAGGVTYAANWDAEAERLAFARDLDFLGVDEYASLSESDRPDDAQLLEGAVARLRRWESLARALDRPIVLTEIGFPDRRTAWRRPHEGRAAEPAPADQARALSAFAAAYARCDRSLVRGFFYWKWPTFERWDGRRADYWPASPQALDALGRAFAVP